MMKNTVFNYDKKEIIGLVNSVDTGMSTAVINDDSTLSQLQVNQLLAVQSPKSGRFIIAMINFVLSAGLCAAAVFIINFVVRKKAGILVTLLHFGPRQVLLLLGISLLIAAVASFLPVHRIASKRPIDAIRDKYADEAFAITLSELSRRAETETKSNI